MRTLLPFAALTLIASSANAQEAMYTAAATMPSPDTYVYRPMLHLWSYTDNPATGEGDFTRLELANRLSYGIARDWAASLELRAILDDVDQPSGTSDTDPGLDSLELEFKYRFYKHDSGGIDTTRAALLFGGDFDVDSEFSANPFVGAVLTVVQGRHGFNQDLILTLNTRDHADRNTGGEGTAEAVHASSAYVYRLWPDRFSSDSRGAWYATAELSLLYETNADFDARFAPGVMFEGYRWAAELMAQLPVYSDVDERPELKFGVGFGLRFSF